VESLLKKDGLRKAPLSKMNMLGLGKKMMEKKNHGCHESLKGGPCGSR